MALTGSGVLVAQQLAATETTQYTAPATVGGNPLKTVTIKSASLCNNSPLTVCPVSLSVVKTGGTAGVANRKLSAYPVAAGDTAVLSELVGVFLGPGDFISAIASALVQTVTVTGGAGTFTLTPVIGGVSATTTAIAFNATAATVQTTLQALANVGTGAVTVAGSAGGPYTVTFANSGMVSVMTGAGAGGAAVAISGSTSTVSLVVSGVVFS